MESAPLDDAESQQLRAEFKDPNTSQSRKREVARKILSALSDVKSKLLRRFQNGEQLSDREIALLTYDEDIDENVFKQISQRQLSENLRDKYIHDYVLDRFHKQLANQMSKESTAMTLAICDVGWVGVKKWIQTDHNFTLTKLLKFQSGCYWEINFLAAGFFFMFDLSHSIYLFTHGRISGNQVIKRMTSSLASNCLAIMGSHLGLAIGAAIGFWLGPIGGFVGSIIGGTIGGVTFSLLGTFRNEKIWSYFDQEEKEKALKELNEKARETLGVTLADDFKTITRKWKTKILEYHPDKHPNATEEEKKKFGLKFQEVHVAYQILKEEELKRSRISEIEIDKIQKSDPVFIVEEDGWADDDNEFI